LRHCGHNEPAQANKKTHNYPAKIHLLSSFLSDLPQLTARINFAANETTASCHAYSRGSLRSRQYTRSVNLTGVFSQKRIGWRRSTNHC
jgi:hypothetical protein